MRPEIPEEGREAGKRNGYTECWKTASLTTFSAFSALGMSEISGPV
jgi:hypothetical protein